MKYITILLILFTIGFIAGDIFYSNKEPSDIEIQTMMLKGQIEWMKTPEYKAHQKRMNDLRRNKIDPVISFDNSYWKKSTIDSAGYIVDDTIYESFGHLCTEYDLQMVDTIYHAINIEHPFWDNDTLFESMTHINLEPEIQFTIGDSIFIIEYGSYMIPIDSIMHHLILLKLKE